MNYPVLVSNIGLDKIHVQSRAIPDMIATFNLGEAGEFLCFAQYKHFEDIGLKDKRRQGLINKIPFEEMYQRIAFLTRRKEEDAKVGAVYLNILQVDPYSSET